MDRSKLRQTAGAVAARIVLSAWVVLWAAFLVREVFFKKNLRDYRVLFNRTADGKRAYVTGDDLYAFIDYCRRNVPAGSTFAFAGLEDGSLDRRRASYYLYPLREAGDPAFVFVYRVNGYARDGYEPFMKLDDDHVILKKAGGA